jgi:hypothetical protein
MIQGNGQALPLSAGTLPRILVGYFRDPDTTEQSMRLFLGFLSRNATHQSRCQGDVSPGRQMRLEN